MVSLIQDDVIFDLQSKGGISRYWKFLKSEVDKDEDISKTVVTTKSKIRYLFNQIPNNELLQEKSIFHSSYYFCYESKNIKSVLTVHDFMPEKYWKGFSLYKHKLLKKVALSRASKVVFINNHLVDEFNRFYPEFRHLPHEVIKHGNSFEIHDFCANLDNQFVYLGSLGDAKNLKFAIEYFSKNRNAKLNCIGFSQQQFNSYCQRHAINTSKLSNIKIHGYLTDKELKTLIRSSTALIIPSIDEGFGLPAIEAISLGVPVLASNIPSFNELLVKDYLLDLNNKSQSFNLIEQIGSDFALRERVFHKQSKLVEQLSWEKAALEYSKIYKELSSEL